MVILAMTAFVGAPNVGGQQPRQASSGEQSERGDASATQTPAGELPHPFAQRIPAPEFPQDIEWLNVGGPLKIRDLRGKFVLLDFWTYCCINCIHILPELKKLEHAYPNELVVIGVHSAKFETEKASKNIEEAILRYEIEHPVVNDSDHAIWRRYSVRSWPSLWLIDPEGQAVARHSGEIRFEDLDRFLKSALPYYRQKKLLDATPIRFDLLSHQQQDTPLRFPGKVLADSDADRLFIADSNHNRIVVTTRQGELLATIGSGSIGRADGDYDSASFDHPQGMALLNETLYVSDTENHLLRKVDLRARQVHTIAGTGVQGRRPWPGLETLQPSDSLPERWVGKPAVTPLNSPWALWVHADALYIAMAGPHQIWKMPLDESEIGPYAGNGREDIVDGPLLPRKPYDTGYSSFAQPSGLASDGKWLYVADSEGSSIRAVPFDSSQSVKTIVGTSNLPEARLFTFGDRDGERDDVLLQHALGVVYQNGKIYVADTYNNKIKIVDAKSGRTRTLAGTGQAGSSDDPGEFDEPAGITLVAGTLYVADTNNHAIRTVELDTGKTGTLRIAKLEPPARSTEERIPSFADATQIVSAVKQVKPQRGVIKLAVQLALPPGWKINHLAPATYWLGAKGKNGPIVRSALGRKSLDKPSASFSVEVPVEGAGKDLLKLGMQYFYCQEGAEGLCKMGSVVWTVPVNVAAAGTTDPLVLSHKVSAGLFP